jgi:hypothetical protein
MVEAEEQPQHNAYRDSLPENAEEGSMEQSLLHAEIIPAP